MLTKKIFLWMHKLALFAVIFASLAPSFSHALAAHQGSNTFMQEVCSTNGKKITIQVVTTQGQLLATEFSTKNSDDNLPKTINHHLAHCPFCANPSTDVALSVRLAPASQILEAQAQHFATVAPDVLTRFSVRPPPAQAPPVL
jgi:hypothetical protein